jgi:SAM-dependent methyltransferase
VTATEDRASLRERLYESYASQHAGYGSGHSTALIYRRDIRPALPRPDAGLVVDIGCGSGELVRLLLADGYDAEGVDVSPEQVALAHGAGLRQVRQGDYRDVLAARVGQLAAVTATDLL